MRIRAGSPDRELSASGEVSHIRKREAVVPAGWEEDLARH